MAEFKLCVDYEGSLESYFYLLIRATREVITNQEWKQATISEKCDAEMSQDLHHAIFLLKSCATKYSAYQELLKEDSIE